ncbi:hypothetical protein EON65_05750 [archaeon]|nr:MAG: hypothetical protein EON65_05750 [archaeon]
MKLFGFPMATLLELNRDGFELSLASFRKPLVLAWIIITKNSKKYFVIVILCLEYRMHQCKLCIITLRAAAVFDFLFAQIFSIALSARINQFGVY